MALYLILSMCLFVAVVLMNFRVRWFICAAVVRLNEMQTQPDPSEQIFEDDLYTVYICDLDKFDEKLKEYSPMLLSFGIGHVIWMLMAADGMIINHLILAMSDAAGFVYVINSMFLWIRTEIVTDSFGITDQVKTMISRDDD